MFKLQKENLISKTESAQILKNQLWLLKAEIQQETPIDCKPEKKTLDRLLRKHYLFHEASCKLQQRSQACPGVVSVFLRPRIFADRDYVRMKIQVLNTLILKRD